MEYNPEKKGWMSWLHITNSYLQEKLRWAECTTHPIQGMVLREWLPEGMTVTQAAKELQVSRVTLSKVLNTRLTVFDTGFLPW